MAITRIKNNQITDLTVDASTKLQDFSITSGKIANNLTYGSDLTVAGNLTISGTTTTVDTTNLSIEDTLLLFASGQTGEPTVDIGFLGERGDATNVAFVWDESSDQFVTAFTSSDDTETNIVVTDYADLQVADLEAKDVSISGNIDISGDATIGGNVDSLDVTGNVTGGNLVTSGTTDTGSLSASTTIDATGNITGGNLITSGATDTGSLSASTTIDATGNITGGNISTSGEIDATGNVNGGNIVTSGATDTGTLSASSTVTATGNISGGNITTDGQVDATGNVSGGNLATSGITQTGSLSANTTISASGNISGGNVVSSGEVDATGNVSGANLVTAGTVDANTVEATSSITAGTTITATGNVSGGNIATSGEVDATGNVTAGNLITSGTTDTGSLTSSTTIEATGNITGGNVSTSGTVNATGNVSGGNIITSGQVDATGNVSGENLTTSGDVDASGGITGDSITANTSVAAPNVEVTSATVNEVFFTDSNSQLRTDSNLTFDTSHLELSGKLTVDNITVDKNTITSPTDVDVVIDSNGAGEFFVDRDTVVSGNLSVLGTTTTINSEEKSIVDPIISIGRGENFEPLTSSDGKDRGIAMFYFEGEEKVAFMGYDDPSNEWRFFDEAIITDEQVTGQLGEINVGGLTTTFVDSSGNISGANLSTSGEVNATGDVSGANFSTSGTTQTGSLSANTTVTATGNISGGNLTTSGTTQTGTLNANSTITATGNISGGNLTTSGEIDATGNINGGNIVTSGEVDATGDVSGANFNTAGTTQTGSLSANTTVTATGNITGGNIITGGVVDATGNITGGNVVTSGTVDADTIESTTSITAGTTITATGNIDGGNLTTAGEVDAAGNVIGGNLVTAGVVDTNTVEATSSITAGTTITATGNVSGGNLTTAGTTQTNSVIADTTITATGNVDGGNITTSGQVTATGNVSGGNITTSGEVNATDVVANSEVKSPVVTSDSDLEITSGTDSNINLNPDGSGEIVLPSLDAQRVLFTSSSKEVATTGNATFDGENLVIDGSLTVDNVKVDGDEIVGLGSSLDVNRTNGDVDLIVGGKNNDSLFVVDAATDSVSIGSQNTTNGAILSINSSDSMLLPSGTTSERPSAPAEGMFRFNTTEGDVEFYDGEEWIAAGTIFTVIESETFSGDGSTVEFTLNEESTTAAAIVTINGVVQLPSTAYAVSGTTLTFTEAPESGDEIEVRRLTTTTTVSSLTNADTSAVFTAIDGQQRFDVTGNLVPTQDVTFNLGSNSSRWNDLFLSGTTISLGNIQIKDTGDNKIGFFQSDGTTPATLDAATDIVADEIASGNSSIGFVSGGGNANVKIGGQNVATFTSSGLSAEIVGNITGDVTGQVSDISNHSTSDLSEGSNLYFTELRARDSVSGAVGIDYNAATGEISLSDTSVSAGTFGSSSEVPVFTVDDQGRITSASTVNVAGVSAFNYDNTTGVLEIDTADGSTFSATVELGPFSTDDLSEGSNLYFTNTRARNALSASGDLSYNSSTGEFSVTTYKSSDFNTDFSGKSTSDLSEGTNLYYTDTRARNALSASGDLSYNSTTGAFSFTERTDAEVRGLVSAAGDLNYDSSTGTFSVTTYKDSDVESYLSGGTGVNFNDGIISIGQPIGTTDDVTFNDVTATGSLLTDEIVAATVTTSGNIVVQGNLTVNGTTTTVNSTTVEIGDNIITLNAGLDDSTAPSQNSGFVVNRGAESDKSFIFDEAVDKWSIGSETLVAGTVEANVNGQVSDISNHSTSDLSEGSNLYFTNTRARNALSASGDLSYDSSTGTFSVTTYKDSDVESYLSGGSGINFSDGIISHSNTSSQSSVNNSGTTVIQDISVDSFGHVTSLGNKSLSRSDFNLDTSDSPSFAGITVPSISKSGSDGSGNIGSSSNSFDTVHAKATSAQYADLAEKYVADAAYVPGTVVAFGGTEEVTVSDADADARIAGVISTNPSYLMNAAAEGEFVAEVALTGRVPTKVTGTVRKGDMMVSNGDGTARAEASPSIGTVIGKALENFDGDEGVIEVVVGRL